MSGYEGGCVILDVANGDILASVSAPSYDQYLWHSAITDDAYVNKAFPFVSARLNILNLLLAMAALEEGVTPKNRSVSESDSEEKFG